MTRSSITNTFVLALLAGCFGLSSTAGAQLYPVETSENRNANSVPAGAENKDEASEKFSRSGPRESPAKRYDQEESPLKAAELSREADAYPKERDASASPEKALIGAIEQGLSRALKSPVQVALVKTSVQKEMTLEQMKRGGVTAATPVQFTYTTLAGEQGTGETNPAMTPAGEIRIAGVKLHSGPSNTSDREALSNRQEAARAPGEKPGNAERILTQTDVSAPAPAPSAAKIERARETAPTKPENLWKKGAAQSTAGPSAAKRQERQQEGLWAVPAELELPEDSESSNAAAALKIEGFQLEPTEREIVDAVIRGDRNLQAFQESVQQSAEPRFRLNARTLKDLESALTSAVRDARVILQEKQQAAPLAALEAHYQASRQAVRAYQSSYRAGTITQSFPELFSPGSKPAV